MRHLKIKWNHSSPRDPVWLYCELDDERWETRKVEVFADGRVGFADASGGVGDTRLGELPVPPDDEFPAGPEFEISEMDPADFERIWAARRG
jgi:hypothetical protein